MYEGNRREQTNKRSRAENNEVKSCFLIYYETCDPRNDEVIKGIEILNSVW